MTMILNRQRANFGLKDVTWLSLIAIYCINLNSSVLPFLFLPVVFVYLLKEKYNIVPLLIAAAFSVSYALFVYSYHFSSDIKAVLMYLMCPSCFYIFGSYIAQGDSDFKKTTRMLMVVVTCFTLFGFLSLYKTLSRYGSIDALTTALNGRVVLNYWNGSLIAATGINTFLSLGLSLGGVLFLSSEGMRKWVKLLCLAVFAVSLYSVVALGNRTGIIIVAAAFIMVYLFAEKFTATKAVRSVLFLLFSVVLILLYQAGLFSAKQTLEGTLMYSRFHQTSMLEDPRIEAWKASFWGLFEHPMGGRLTELPQVKYAHNLWLDVGYTAGVMPFLLLLIFTILAIRTLIMFVRSDAPVMLKGIFIGLFTAFFITFFFEPIMEGWFSYFTVFCLIFGMLHRLNFERGFTK